MIIKLPAAEDIDKIIRLNNKYYFSNLSDEQIERGFLGKLYSTNELNKIIEDKEIIIASENGKLVGYYLIGNKEDKDASIYLRNKFLCLYDNYGNPISGIAYPTQVCIDEAFRSSGLFGKMLEALIMEVKDKYTSILCSISVNNIVSVRAHIRYGWEMINTFERRMFLRYNTEIPCL